MLGLIVGALLLDIYIEHNPMTLYDFDMGTVGHLASMLAVFSVPVVLIVLVVELAVHQTARMMKRRHAVDG